MKVADYEKFMEDIARIGEAQCPVENDDYYDFFILDGEVNFEYNWHDPEAYESGYYTKSFTIEEVDIMLEALQ